MRRLFDDWYDTLMIAMPETVIGWCRKGWKYFWHRKSKLGKTGRPPIDAAANDLIQRMSRDDVTRGAPDIVSQLALLGHHVAESTVAKYMVRHPEKPPQTWRTFLVRRNNMAERDD